MGARRHADRRPPKNTGAAPGLRGKIFWLRLEDPTGLREEGLGNESTWGRSGHLRRRPQIDRPASRALALPVDA
jgi:hypothetical protein